LDRSNKEQLIARLSGLAGRAQLVLLVNYRGMKVSQLNKLRRDLDKSAECEFLVAKNTLVRRAFTGTGFEKLSDLLVGTNALLFAYDDPVAPTKVLTESMKLTPALEIKGGVLTGKLINPAQIQNLAKMPGKRELHAMLAGTIAAPIRNLAGALAGVPRGLLNALNAVKQQKEKQAA